MKNVVILGAFAIGAVLYTVANDRSDVREEVRQRIRSTVRNSVRSVERAPRVVIKAPENAFVSLTRIGDDQTKMNGFSVSEPVDVRVLVMGEGVGNEMADYGFILDATTREAVWRMEKQMSRHAGGATKNRFVDEVIHLNPGKYLAYYTTDGSHSYNDWNSSAPSSPGLWGLTLSLASGAVASPDVISGYAPLANDPSVIAQITKVGEEKDEMVMFSLASDTKVRIYAIGEASSSEMLDYATLRHSDGTVVWNMNYRETLGAGGSDRNRFSNDLVTLSAGSYILQYKSDRGHSFNDWNWGAPHDPDFWGVTLFKVDE